ILLIALAVSIPARSFKYAGIALIGSVTGGMFGYLIGYEFFELFGRKIIDFYGIVDEFNYVGIKYNENAFYAIAVAGFTPIPYKVFTIAAGTFKVNFMTLVLASLVSRFSRFFLVAALIWKFGPSIKSFIDRYFNILSIVFVILLIGGILFVKLLI
ncbi:MAG: YqaA family protein, partial [bacterium]